MSLVQIWIWIRIWQNDADPLDPDSDPQDWLVFLQMGFGSYIIESLRAITDG